MGTVGIALGMICVLGGFVLLLFSLGFAEQLREYTKRLVIISIAMMVLGIILGVTAEPSADSSSGDRCRNCGRKTDLVAGFGYCYSCYEGYNNWQKEYYGD